MSTFYSIRTRRPATRAAWWSRVHPKASKQTSPYSNSSSQDMHAPSTHVMAGGATQKSNTWKGSSEGVALRGLGYAPAPSIAGSGDPLLAPAHPLLPRYRDTRDIPSILHRWAHSYTMLSGIHTSQVSTPEIPNAGACASAYAWGKYICGIARTTASPTHYRCSRCLRLDVHDGDATYGPDPLMQIAARARRLL